MSAETIKAITLEDIKAEIVKHLKSDLIIGQQLRLAVKILAKDSKKKIEVWARDEFEMDKSRVYQLVDFAEVHEILSKSKTKDKLDKLITSGEIEAHSTIVENEAQARAIARAEGVKKDDKLVPDKVVAAFIKAAKKAKEDGKKITAAFITSALGGGSGGGGNSKAAVVSLVETSMVHFPGMEEGTSIELSSLLDLITVATAYIPESKLTRFADLVTQLHTTIETHKAKIAEIEDKEKALDATAKAEGISSAEIAESMPNAVAALAAKNAEAIN